MTVCASDRHHQHFASTEVGMVQRDERDRMRSVQRRRKEEAEREGEGEETEEGEVGGGVRERKSNEVENNKRCG